MAKLALHIIESPAADDILHKRFEGSALRKAMELHDVPVTHDMVVDLGSFEKAVQRIVDWYDGPGLLDDRLDEDFIPVVHISAHGNPRCIATTDGSGIAWLDLVKKLGPLADLESAYLLSMSSCHGFGVWRNVGGTKTEEHGIGYIVGPTETPTWSATFVAFCTLYHHLNTGVTDLEKAVKAMKMASRHQSFECIDAATARSDFLRERREHRNMLLEQIRSW